MVDKNIIQSRFTKLGVVPIDNQHYLYATLDNNLIGIIVVIKTCDNHYFDEDHIDIGKEIKCNIVVNHHVELTEEEKAEARQKAIRQYQEEEIQKMKNRSKKAKPTTTQTNTAPTLFDF
ncbi:hypothetical protein GKE16_26210 [Escherichia coli]|nr:hypothetical protein [Escherichia coli]